MSFLLLLSVLGLGLWLRVGALHAPPLDFHPTRQYRSAIIARGMYYETATTISQAERRIARENRARQGIIEPPVLETLAVVAYRSWGGERLWLPRLFAVLSWIVGGLFLYRIGMRLRSEAAALVAVGCYTLLPFGVFASRSFQPDPLMVSCVLIAMLGIMRYVEKPTLARLVVSGIASGLAVFVKLSAVFFVLCAFLSVLVYQYRRGHRASAVHTTLFVLLSVAPAGVFLWYGLFVHDFLRSQIEGRFLPHLLVSDFFWHGWLGQVRRVVGATPLIGALFGTVAAGKTAYRYLLIGLWFGYASCSLFFTYHTPTHDYYHLPLIPIVALGLCSLFARLAHSLPSWASRRRILTVAAIAALVATLVAVRGIVRDMRDPVILHLKARTYERIAAYVDGEPLVLLDPYYGFPLRYHGRLSQISLWPSAADLMAARLAGRSGPGIEAKLKAHVAERDSYFVVTDFDSFNAQPELKVLLERNFVLAVDDFDFVIFDLRNPRHADAGWNVNEK